jgi:cytochrome P450
LNGRLPTYEDTPHLPYALAVLQETLRLYPSVWVLTREAKNDDELGGYLIHARSTVAVVPFLTHRHPDLWDRPEEFRPERFLDGQPKHKFAYYPFGGGPRLCIGMGFALLEGQLVLAAMANRYRLEMAPGARPVMHPSLTLRPRHGLQMVRHRRH